MAKSSVPHDLTSILLRNDFNYDPPGDWNGEVDDVLILSMRNQHKEYMKQTQIEMKEQKLSLQSDEDEKKQQIDDKRRHLRALRESKEEREM